MTNPAAKTATAALFPVVAAALIAHGRVLVQQRPEGKQMAGLWEFPGGKIEPGESPQAALVRELAEELDVTVAEDALVPVTFASEALGDRHLVLLLFACRDWQGDAQALDAAAIRWVTLDDMRGLAMPPADAPFIDALERFGVSAS